MANFLLYPILLSETLTNEQGCRSTCQSLALQRRNSLGGSVAARHIARQCRLCVRLSRMDVSEAFLRTPKSGGRAETSRMVLQIRPG